MESDREFAEEDCLSISGIQHFEFCKRQWALIHIENQWEENYLTVDGELMHENAHNEKFTELRKNILITRSLRIISRKLGVVGQCDVVEFHKDDVHGINLFNHMGKFIPVPIEYKHGKNKIGLEDKLQIACEAMCLEEMLCCTINKGYLYYGKTRHREIVEIDSELREKVKSDLSLMHQYYREGYTPPPKKTKSCNSCSLMELCIPLLTKKNQGKAYILRTIKEDYEKTT